MSQIHYTRLILRVRALQLDALLIVCAALVALLLGDLLGLSNPYAKLALPLIVAFILGPGMVAWTGGTAGHHWVGIRVARLDGQGKIGLFAATLRLAVKLALGWFSFFLVLTTRKHQAVHDLVARSIVVHKHPESRPSYELLPEREPESASWIYPGRLRRVFVILAWWLLATITMGVLSLLLISTPCSLSEHCTSWEYLASLALNIAWLVSLALLLVRGWGGRLYGCRRTPAAMQ